MIRIKNVFVLCIILLSSTANAQYFSGGQDPSFIKWRQINTAYFQIIYPSLFEAKAQRFAKAMEVSYPYVSKGLSYQPDKIPIVIHTSGVMSNGFVAWAPKRIEVVSCPPQDMYAQDWMKQLSLHEYRHVVQIGRNNKGFAKFLSCLLGEQAAAMTVGLYVPPWFMEGDAVFSETKFSKAGRGKDPDFEMGLRAQLLQKGKFTYDKASMGSYKDYIPNKYELGYQVVTHVRKNYGEDAWTHVLDEVANKFYAVTPFEKGLKKITGKGKLGIYNQTMDTLFKQWKRQDAENDTTRYVLLNKPIKTYHEFIAPTYYSADEIVSFYKDLDYPFRLVKINNEGNVKSIADIGYLSSKGLNVNQVQQKAVWSQITFDPRWTNRNYANIRVYDFLTGQTKKLTHKGRYFAPSFLPDAKSIVCVKVFENNDAALVLLDGFTGKEIKTLLYTDKDFFMTPASGSDGKSIVYIRLSDRGKSIETIDIETLKVSCLLPFSFANISEPEFAEDYVLFNAPYSGIQNIYAVHRRSAQVYQVTSARFGACNAHYNQKTKKMLYANYNVYGYDVAEIPFNPESWKPLYDVRDNSISLYKHFENENTTQIVDDKNLPDTVYASAPYCKSAHLFNFHSWAPAYVNVEDSDYGVGVSLMSQNVLSTANTTVGYKYDPATERHGAHIDFHWQGWYPDMKLKASYEFCKAKEEISEDYFHEFHYQLFKTKLSVGLPLSFNYNNHILNINTTVSTHFASVLNSNALNAETFSGNLNWQEYVLQFYHQTRKAHRDFLPKWGQAMSLKFVHSPFNGTNLGEVIGAQAKMYVPGILSHHSFNIRGGIQYRFSGTDNFFGNIIFIPRGYVYNNYKEIKSASVNYQFPACYPDYSLGAFAYIKRVRINMFYDVARASYKEKWYNLQSVGSELFVDANLLRFVFPMSVGISAGYKVEDKQYFANFVFSMNLTY